MKFIHLLQLTQSLYTWLKIVSLSFFLKIIVQASQDIVCSSNRESPNQPSAKETNLPSYLFQKDTPDIFILNLALKPATSVCLSSGIGTYALMPRSHVQRPRLSLVARWIKYIPDGSTKQLKRVIPCSVSDADKLKSPVESRRLKPQEPEFFHILEDKHMLVAGFKSTF